MPRKILITDDSMVARMLLGNILRETGAELIEAADGETALEFVSSDEHIDLVFMDLTMPGIGGIEALRRIKILRPSLPVVIVTADIQKQTIADGMAAGAFDVLRKKIDHGDIMDLLERLHRSTKAQ